MVESCRGPTRSAPGCSTRPGTPAPGWAWVPATWPRRCVTCRGPSASSPWATARRGAPTGRRRRSTRRPARSAPRARPRWPPGPPQPSAGSIPGGPGGAGAGTRRSGGAGGGSGAAAGHRRAGLAGGGRGAGRAPGPAHAALRRRAVRRGLPGRRLAAAVSGPPVLAVVGPTATGKTALAVELVRRLGGEVVNADSMQLYRGMDIGTAKPTLEERGGVPHHVYDLWSVREPASVAEYRRHARAAIDRLRAAGVVPLLVGGSGLYVRAVLDELDLPGTDPAVRARLEAELAATGPGELHARLATVDPVAAEAILPSNG